MSEYHSFSLAQHLPTNNKTKKDVNRGEHQLFHHHPHSASSNASQQQLHTSNTFINEQQQQQQQQQEHHNWLTNSDHQGNFDILNSTTNFTTAHTRSHTTPAIMNTSTTNDVFHPLFDFVLPPFNQSSSHSNNNTTAHHSNEMPSSSATLLKCKQQQQQQHASIFSFDHDHPLNNHHAGQQQDDDDEEERSIIPYFDGIEETHHYTHSKNDYSSHDDFIPSNQFKQDDNVQVQPAKLIQNTSNSMIQRPAMEQEMNNSTRFLEFQLPTSCVNTSVSSRMIQSNTNKMKSAIQAHLVAHDPIEDGERTVIIMTSKVAQKSYGTEKRFLCPPPTAILVGSSWWTPSSQQQNDAVFHDKDNIIRAPPSLTICLSGECSRQSGRIEWYGISGTLVGQTGGSSQKLIVTEGTPQTNNNMMSVSSLPGETKSSDDWYRNTKNEALAGGKCVLKRLYINDDADEKRKKVQCLIKVQLANGLELGTISSRRIKVISKPSKKRQSDKNIELCIFHGTTVSLFNRIRSQTVSTKYLGVSSTSVESSVFEYPGRMHHQQQQKSHRNDTCFVARASTWDPFIIWLVDTTPQYTMTPDQVNSSCRADEYIGCPSLIPSIPYPDPPTIALKNKTNQPLSIRYNQHVVLQCLTTGLVSPVMIVRKVDKISTVVGGARCPDDLDASFSGGGGEYGDEVLGDPVSQLHKIAFQIVQYEHDMQHHAQRAESNHFNDGGIPPGRQHGDMMPQMAIGQTYLACLNDLVGTHKTTDQRIPIKGIDSNINLATTTTKSYHFTASALSATLNTMLPSSSSRKRHVSLMEEQANDVLLTQAQVYNMANASSEIDGARRRMSSLDDAFNSPGSSSARPQTRLRSHSIPTTSAAYNKPTNRKHRMVANSALAEFGAYWSEDVTDAAVWTIVGTECAQYSFWTLPHLDKQQQAITAPFPYLTHFTISSNSGVFSMMTLSGENFTRDLQIWFGNIKAPLIEYRSREMLVCRVPPREELMQSVGLKNHNGVSANEQTPYYIRILLVRGDGVVYKTSQSYSFS